MARMMSASDVLRYLRDPKMWEDAAIHARLREDFERAQKLTDKWGFIRQMYVDFTLLDDEQP